MEQSYSLRYLSLSSYKTVNGCNCHYGFDANPGKPQVWVFQRTVFVIFFFPCVGNCIFNGFLTIFQEVSSFNISNTLLPTVSGATHKRKYILPHFNKYNEKNNETSPGNHQTGALERMMCPHPILEELSSQA